MKSNKLAEKIAALENELSSQKQKSPIKPPNNTPYLLAVLFMLSLAVVGVIVIIYLRPDIEFLVVVASVSGIIMPTTLSLLAFMKSQETHLSVNGRLDAFIKTAEENARRQGEQIGRDKANARTDALADKTRGTDV